jgi:hypothetical protein
MRRMDQSAQCQNCETTFDTPGVAIGKTAIVLCPRCKKAVVVQGQVDPQDAAPTGPTLTGFGRTGRDVPDRTGPIPRPVADRTGPIPRSVPDRTGPISIPGLSTGPVSIPGLDRTGPIPVPGLDRLDRTGPVHTGPIATGPIERESVKEEDSHAWRTRPIAERTVVDREKKIEETPPKPAEPNQADQAETWKIAAMGFFTVACTAFLAVRVYHFYHPSLPPETAARIDANDHAFEGISPVTEDGVAVAVIGDQYARALAGASEHDICMNAWFQGLRVAKVRTQTGHPVADCSFLIRPHH